MITREEFQEELVKQLNSQGVEVSREQLAKAIEEAMGPQAERLKRIDKLSHYVAEDAEEALDKLESWPDDSTPADEIVSMWEPLEGIYSVGSLLDAI